MFKNARILILLLLLGSGTNMFSQQLSQQVLVPVAGVTSAGAINYSQTIGETAVEIIGNADFIFTQGFQQPGIKLSYENPPTGNGVKVYPNPVTDFVNIELFGDASRSFRIDIINISGTIVRTEKMVFTDPFWHIQQFPVDQLAKGLYFVRIVSGDGLISRTFKIDKM
ncbi:MAG: T9SS type A sorting domain-containing protein [Bacteroidia bacterium]|nr:T9SS type A sorting domain-containing protein [Bacteroidia bacterium]